MRIKKSTLKYLSDLKKNNNREWYNEHKDIFLKEQSKIKEVHNVFLENLNKHDKIERYKLYRIYRDVRFSKDKTPYQPHFAASFSRKGKELRGSYYIQIKPDGNSFLGGGFWNPEKEDLMRIRKEFELDSSEMREILADKKFISIFGKIEGNELKTAPRGFDKNHPDIDLIRKKGFVAIRRFTDEEVLSNNFINIVDDSFKTLRPFFDLFSDILTTDLNGESSIV